jgi:general secretion pathway protein G
MISLKRKQSGFTIVELLIVIVIIGILATLVIVTFTGIQQRARNTKRQTDINAIDSHLEAFNADTGYYPLAADLTDCSGTPTGAHTWVSSNMKGLDPAALQDPQGSAECLYASSGSGKYSYVPLDAAGNACTTDGGSDPCVSFTLTASYEGTVGGASTYSKTSH